VTEQTATKTEPLQTPFEYDRHLVISVAVSDFDAAMAWYANVLGFEEEYRLDDYGWGELRTPYPGVYVGLGQSEEVKHGGPTPTFGVKDIAAARAHLEAHDVRFDGDTYDVGGMVKLATFYDPDGNAWMLAESKRER
jgi:catechol 2,3-dioxygenase-like lactoylglutathione lyase family enzyme